jgi:hypothetical protein
LAILLVSDRNAGGGVSLLLRHSAQSDDWIVQLEEGEDVTLLLVQLDNLSATTDGRFRAEISQAWKGGSCYFCTATLNQRLTNTPFQALLQRLTKELCGLY